MQAPIDASSCVFKASLPGRWPDENVDVRDGPLGKAKSYANSPLLPFSHGSLKQKLKIKEMCEAPQIENSQQAASKLLNYLIWLQSLWQFKICFSNPSLGTCSFIQPAYAFFKNRKLFSLLDAHKQLKIREERSSCFLTSK